MFFCIKLYIPIQFLKALKLYYKKVQKNTEPVKKYQKCKKLQKALENYKVPKMFKFAKIQESTKNLKRVEILCFNQI